MPGTRVIKPVFRGRTPQGPMKDGEGENPDNSWIVDTAQKILTGLAGAAWWGTKSMNQPTPTPTRPITSNEQAFISGPKTPNKRYNPMLAPDNSPEGRWRSSRSKKKY
jgi:hypothetical protein